MIIQDTNHQALPSFDKLWNYNDPAATRSKFTEILPQAEASSDTAYLAELLTQIARTYSLENAFDQAHSLLDRVEKMLTPAMKVPRTRYLLERGRCLNSASRQAEAVPLFAEAATIATDAGAMRLAIDAIHMLGIAESDPAKQIEWNLKGIAMAEADSTQAGWLWPLYNNIGESYLKLSDYQHAYHYFHKLADYQAKRLGEADIFTLKDEAKCLRLLGKPAEALERIEPIAAKLAAEQKEDGYICTEQAEALEALGRHAEAKPIFAKALELLKADDWFINNDKEQLQRLKHFSSH